MSAIPYESLNKVPAVVQQASSVGQDILVIFAKLGQGLGVFYWPDDKVVHLVSRRSILDNNLAMQPRAAGGRLWFVENALTKNSKRFDSRYYGNGSQFLLLLLTEASLKWVLINSNVKKDAKI
ncbi:hypothetical protein PoB_006271500 [Plakobranchus ocellatus]|uniref:Uncharacterized protein n=1 Tax=Plakobranchus ocellatus TaxID=259542 RepID=A0AAV4CWI0_9GAST|nr:hypothetical protein PoB_006271500 [Plakobranchus ocellatus]